MHDYIGILFFSGQNLSLSTKSIKLLNELIIAVYVSFMISTWSEPGDIWKASCGNHVCRTCRKLRGKVL
jgi:hypothetical protein